LIFAKKSIDISCSTGLTLLHTHNDHYLFILKRAPPLEIKTLNVIFLTAKIAVKQETIAKELIKTSQSSHPLKQRGDLMSLATMNF
jgi:hypothetical protein